MKKAILVILFCCPILLFSKREFSAQQYWKLNNAVNSILSFYVDSISDSILVENAIRGILEQLDPHSTYIPASEIEKANESINGNFEGIGISFQMIDDTLQVLQIISGCPAQKVGVLLGDQLIRVDGVPISGVKMTTSEITKKIRGPKGSEVIVDIKRKGEKELIPFHIIRDKIPIHTLDAAYKIEEQKRQQEINIAQINAEISKRERMVELENREVEIQEMKLAAEINKVADSKRYAAEQAASADLFARQKAAEAKKYEKAQEAEALKIEAEAEAAAQIARANALKEAALAEAQGIEAKGKAEADAIKAKADAMKQYGEAATLQLILDSGVLPEIVSAYSKPMAEALAKIDSITMYGEGNTAKLTEEISKNGSQIFEGLEKATGLDVKSLLAGYLGGKLISKDENNKK